MLKIEKLNNGYFLEIEFDTPINQSIDKEMETVIEQMGNIFPQIQKMIESDPTLAQIKNDAQKGLMKYVIKPVTKDNKIYFNNFKSLLGYITLLTEDLDRDGVLIKPEINLINENDHKVDVSDMTKPKTKTKKNHEKT